MRDIRFRGKTLKGEWIVGDLLRTNGQTGDGWAIQYEDPESGWMMEDVRVGTIGQFTGLHDKDGRDIYEGDLVEMMRIYPDVHLKGGNINLERARELNPEVTDLTLENAGELATQVGVKVRVRCETEAKFTELLQSEGFSVERKAVKEVAYVAKKGSDVGDSGEQAGDNGGGNQGGELEG